jgi:cell division protein FtsW (lipid II flippase)
MALTALTISCFLFYATSKYFPLEDWSAFRKHKLWVNLAAGAISLLSLYLFTVSHDFSTALMTWMIALMTLLSSIVLSVKMNNRWIWVWCGLCVLFLIIDLA